ncbi:hypothetical protein MIND_00877700 [Mycena indigotica]|uniref:Uncharacterized protein n=1 Tax=Mycena indigotica TaxID=2126181 RepID=A0A8H6SHZ1_9AGAR|nr:uncharacterized protein MIND_00877700 [Mycena indigotica]KAF7299288.1 hypothetical protein MIND_00877700 [Mycena indigotica]
MFPAKHSAEISTSGTFPFLSLPTCEILRDIHELLDAVDWQASFLPYWDHDEPHFGAVYDSPEIRHHLKTLQLRKPDEDFDEFEIILHDLGGFSQHPLLRDRVARLFSPTNKFLVNASGTGKTRLCYEGLCVNWGLYFTIEVDTGYLGSNDLERKLSQLIDETELASVDHSAADGPERVQRNSDVANRWFGAILLARLLLFQQFLEISSRGSLSIPNRQMRWLEFQLSPRVLGDRLDYLGEDVFVTLANTLATNDSPNLAENIDDVIRKLQTSIGTERPIFIIIDEAQVAVDHLPSAFGDGKPFLWELLRSWSALTKGACTFICAGVRIPASLFTGEVGRDFEWTSDTGAFDDPDEHEKYIAKFLPPTFRDSPPGRFLISRLWRWCRGRHRLTDRFLSFLLTEGLEYPHTCLTRFVKDGTELKALDAVRACHDEAAPRDLGWAFRFGTPNFTELDPDTKNIVLDILYQSMAERKTNTFGADQISLVQRAYARFIDVNLSQVRFDEPFILVIAARQLFPIPVEPLGGRPNDRPSTFITSLQLNPPPTRQGVAHCLAFYLSQVFGRTRMLTDIFKFPHAAPGLVKRLNSSLAPLVTATRTLEETIEWIEHAHGTAFCMPSSPNIDLLCAVRLAEGSFIWLAIRTIAANEPVNDETLQPLVSLLDIDHAFSETGADSASIKRATDALRSLPGVKQRPCFLRAVTSFPVEADIRQCVDKRCRDVANLSFRALRRNEDQVMQEDFFEAMVNGAIAGTKRKSRWDDGALQENRKRAKELQEELRIESNREFIRTMNDVDPHYSWDMKGFDFTADYDPLDAVPAARQPPPLLVKNENSQGHAEHRRAREHVRRT